MKYNQEMAVVKNEQIRGQLDRSTEHKKGAIDTLRYRTGKALDIMIHKNQSKLLWSKKRAVFEAWRSVAREQRRFLLNITRISEKSFQAEGFARIQEAYMANRGKKKVEVMLTRWFNRFTRDHLRHAWSRWKLSAFKMAYDQEQEARELHQEMVGELDGKRGLIQDQNVQNIYKYLRKVRKIKLWRAWLSTRQYAKMRAINTREAADKFAIIKRKKYLQKWMLRVSATKRLRIKRVQFHQHYLIRMKLKVWEVLLFKKSVNNTMALCLSNFERMMRTKMMSDAFKDVKSFYMSKKHATGVFTKRSTLDALSILCQRHEKISRMYFNRHRHAVTDEAQRKKRIKAIFGKFNA